MKLFKRLPLLITAVLSVITAGCIPSELYLKVDMSEPGTDLKIAAVLPLSGRNKVAAEQMAEGMKMAEYELNANSVTGRGQLQLKFFDSKGSADGAMEAVERPLLRASRTSSSVNSSPPKYFSIISSLVSARASKSIV